MRRSGPILCLALLGCSAEKSFDERYEQADKAIREKAAAIDAELTGSETPRASDAAMPADDASAPSAP
jgi:hypothetical protein